MERQQSQINLSIGHGPLRVDLIRWKNHTGDIAIPVVGIASEGWESTVRRVTSHDADAARFEVGGLRQRQRTGRRGTASGNRARTSERQEERQ